MKSSNIYEKISARVPVRTKYKSSEELKRLPSPLSEAALPNDSIGEAIWQGFASYINYQFNDKWRTSFRGEIFNDQNGYRTGVVQLWKEATFTVGYATLECFELRAEARHDFSNVNSFLKANGVDTSNNQQSFAIEGVVKFL